MDSYCIFFQELPGPTKSKNALGNFLTQFSFAILAQIGGSVSEPVVTSMTNLALTKNPSNVKIARHQKIKKCLGQFVHHIFLAILKIKFSIDFLLFGLFGHGVSERQANCAMGARNPLSNLWFPQGRSKAPKCSC